MRGKIFWCRYSFQGRQYQVSLEKVTNRGDHQTLAVAADPMLSGAEPIREEAKLYISSKVAEGKFTRDAAGS